MQIHNTTVSHKIPPAFFPAIDSANAVEPIFIKAHVTERKSCGIPQDVNHCERGVA